MRFENKVLAWRSLPGSDVVTAGSVNFDAARGGRSTQVSVHLQYAPPAGKAGALVPSLFGREPSQTILENLRHFKQCSKPAKFPVPPRRERPCEAFVGKAREGRDGGGPRHLNPRDHHQGPTTPIAARIAGA